MTSISAATGQVKVSVYTQLLTQQHAIPTGEHCPHQLTCALRVETELNSPCLRAVQTFPGPFPPPKRHVLPELNKHPLAAVKVIWEGARPWDQWDCLLTTSLPESHDLMSPHPMGREECPKSLKVQFEALLCHSEVDLLAAFRCLASVQRARSSPPPPFLSTWGLQ